jgi:hypothetical protein
LRKKQNTVCVKCQLCEYASPVNELMARGKIVNKGLMSLAAGAISLVCAGILVGSYVGHTAAAKDLAKQAESAATSVEKAAPDSIRALHDLLGRNADGSLRKLPRLTPQFWGTYDFVHDGRDHHVVFYAMKPLDELGRPDVCPECSPALAAMTYRKRGGTWEVAARDLAITQLGKYGEPLPVYSVTAFPLGGVPAIAIWDIDAANGYKDAYTHLFAYSEGWTYLSGFLVAEDNMESTACTQKRHCYSWKGELKALVSKSNGFPDLVLERHGTRQTLMGDAILPATTDTHRFNGRTYHDQDQMSLPALAQHQPTAPQQQGESMSSGRHWYAPDVNFTSCNRSRSPAERIKMIQDDGRSPKIVDLPNGVVEVALQTTVHAEQVWTYYPDEAACIAALPGSKPIPSRYR